MDNKTEIKRLEDRIRQMNIENENIRKKQEKQNAHIKMQEEKIEEYKKQIEELKKEDVVWKPESGEDYYVIHESGRILHCANFSHVILDEDYELGNCFKTEEEAEKVVRHLKTRAKLQRIADRLNNGEKIDWKSNNTTKYFLLFDYEKNCIVCDFYWTYKNQGTIYCLDENFKDIAIKEIGEEELTAYLKGE